MEEIRIGDYCKDNIKSIVTKEQFKSVEYIVGGKE